MPSATRCPPACAARPTGRAGDVILCHPFLVHAASWPHAGWQPRIMAQPGVALHDAFPLVPPLSPVELAMAETGWPDVELRRETGPDRRPRDAAARAARRRGLHRIKLEVYAFNPRASPGISSKGRPPWRSRDIDQQVEFGQWLRRNVADRVDASHGTPQDTAGAIAAWIDGHLRSDASTAENAVT